MAPDDAVVADDKPYTPEELMNILVAPSGGMIMLPSHEYDEVYENVFIGEE